MYAVSTSWRRKRRELIDLTWSLAVSCTFKLPMFMIKVVIYRITVVSLIDSSTRWRCFIWCYTCLIIAPPSSILLMIQRFLSAADHMWNSLQHNQWNCCNSSLVEINSSATWRTYRCHVKCIHGTKNFSLCRMSKICCIQIINNVRCRSKGSNSKSLVVNSLC